MLQRARGLSGAGVWFLTVRVAEVAIVVLLAGAFVDARSAWQVGSQYVGNEGPTPGVAKVTFMQRMIGMALFGGYRGPISMLVVALALVVLLTVLHRCQPVDHTRVLRWEWLTLWGLSVLLTFAASAVVVIAFFGDDPFAPTDPGVVTGNIGPGFHEQLLGSLSWPLGTLLLLLPLGVWWARLPDMDDLEDALAGVDHHHPRPAVVEEGRVHGVAAVPGADRAAGRAADPGADPAVEPAPAGRWRRGGGGSRGGRDRDGDAILVDEVEQIEPVERLMPRGGEVGDGSSSSGYEGYFRRQ